MSIVFIHRENDEYNISAFFKGEFYGKKIMI